MRPGPTAAQTGVVVAAHVGRSPAAPGGVMLDLGTEVQQGLWGVRLGAGMDAAGTALGPVISPTNAGSGVWSSDLDLGLNLARVPYVSVLLGRTDPTVFVGGGVAGVSTTDGATAERSSSLVPTWSVGARGGVPLTTWAALEVEARRRATFGAVTPDVYPVNEGWEYRAGIAFRFGGRSAPSPMRAPGARSPTRTGDRPGRRAPTDVRRSESAEEIAERAIRTADQYVGTPYRWGGDSPAEGFDCSGFVQYVFRQHGIDLPRVSRDQARTGLAMETSLDNLARGDLLFFAQGGPTVDHVAIYAGDGRIIHSSSSGSGVRYDDLTGNRGRWYVQHLVAVRRVIGGETVVSRAVQPGAEDLPEARRELPLDEAFETLVAERGDVDAPLPDR